MQWHCRVHMKNLWTGGQVGEDGTTKDATYNNGPIHLRLITGLTRIHQ